MARWMPVHLNSALLKAITATILMPIGAFASQTQALILPKSMLSLNRILLPKLGGGQSRFGGLTKTNLQMAYGWPALMEALPERSVWRNVSRQDIEAVR